MHAMYHVRGLCYVVCHCICTSEKGKKLKLIWKSIRKVNGKALILRKYFNWYNWSNSFQLSILKQKIYVKIWYNQFKSLQFRNLPFLIFSFRKHVIASGFIIGSRKKTRSDSAGLHFFVNIDPDYLV